MICNSCNFIFRNNRIKMSYQKILITSGGISEIEYDDEENGAFQTNSTEFNEDKTIPLVCLSSNLIGLTSRYYRNLGTNW